MGNSGTSHETPSRWLVIIQLSTVDVQQDDHIRKDANINKYNHRARRTNIEQTNRHDPHNFTGHASIAMCTLLDQLFLCWKCRLSLSTCLRRMHDAFVPSLYH